MATSGSDPKRAGPRIKRETAWYRAELEEYARRLAWRQAGIITRSQALEAGMTARHVRVLVESGRWRRLSRGVYATDQMDWYQIAWAGLLMAGEGACLGGRAAAFLDGFDAQPETIDVWVPPGNALPRPGSSRETVSWRFRRGCRTAVGTPPRSCVEETVLDLCEEMLALNFAHPDRMEQWNERMYPVRIRVDLRGLLTAAISTGLTSVDGLLAAAGRTPNREGRHLVEWELGEITAGRPIFRDGASLYRRRKPGESRIPTD